MGPCDLTLRTGVSAYPTNPRLVPTPLMYTCFKEELCIIAFTKRLSPRESLWKR